MGKIAPRELFELMKGKLHKAGLTEEHADIVADVLLHAELRGVDSHGAIRVEYYSERINKGGTNRSPRFKFNKTGPCSGIFEGDNGAGHVVAKLGMEQAIKMAKENGISVVGMRELGHAGALSYFVQMAATEELCSISVCQSDPMAVPYGAAEPFYGTHPIAFGAPGKDGRDVIIDLATTISAWGRVLSARAKGTKHPAAVDKDGNITDDPFKVTALLHIAGAKGYGGNDG
jgi:ureidoglycolate dehydrogenase (NAD+)